MATSAAQDAPASKAQVTRLEAALKRLYTSPKAGQDEIIDTHYAPNIEFADNLFAVQGLVAFRTQMHGVSHTFKSVEFEVISSDARVDEATGTTHVDIANKQTYVWGSKTIPLEVDTALVLDPSGRITKHDDTWRGKYKPPHALRRASGATSTLVMRIMGLGTPAASSEGEEKKPFTTPRE